MTCRQALAIATGPGRPTELLGSIDAVAAELRRRATSPGHLWVRRACLAAPGHPTEVLAVRDRGWSDDLVGYVCGLGHDQAALDEALAAGAAVGAPA